MSCHKIVPLMLVIASVLFCSTTVFAPNQNSVVQSYEPGAVSDSHVGQSSNGLCIGVRVWGLDGTESNQNEVFIYIFNSSLTNGVQDLIAPPGFQRAEIALYDSSGLSVPHTVNATIKRRDYTNYADVPKDAHGVRSHLFSTLGETPMPYEYVTIDKEFRVVKTGHYTLVVKGRVLNINKDSSLSEVRFDPVAIPIYIGNIGTQKTPVNDGRLRLIQAIMISISVALTLWAFFAYMANKRIKELPK